MRNRSARPTISAGSDGSAMTIGVPKEIKQRENRVALLPSAAWQLVQRGQRVLVEKDAGAGAGYEDAEYQKAGCEIVTDAASVFEAADLIVKVKEPQPREIAMLRPKHTLFTYLHLAADRALTEGLMKSGCTAIAYETVEKNRRLPLLERLALRVVVLTDDPAADRARLHGLEEHPPRFGQPLAVRGGEP